MIHGWGGWCRDGTSVGAHPSFCFRNPVERPSRLWNCNLNYDFNFFLSRPLILSFRLSFVLPVAEFCATLIQHFMHSLPLLPPRSPHTLHVGRLSAVCYILCKAIMVRGLQFSISDLLLLQTAIWKLLFGARSLPQWRTASALLVRDV